MNLQADDLLSPTELAPKRRRKKHLASHLTFLVITGLFIVFTILTIIVVYSVGYDYRVAQFKELTLLAKDNAETAADLIQTALDKQDVLISSLIIIESGEPSSRTSFLGTLLGQVKKEEVNLLSLYYISSKDPHAPEGFTVYATEKFVGTAENQTEILSEEAYKDVETTKKMSIIDPHIKRINNVDYLVISIVQPVLDENNNCVGVVGCDIDTALLNSAVYETGNFKSFSNAIICAHQRFIINTSNPSSIGKRFSEGTRSQNPELILDIAKGSGKKAFSDIQTDGKKIIRAGVPFSVGNSDTVWISVTSVDRDEMDAPIIRILVMIVIISVVALILLAFLSYVIISKCLKPIKHLEQAAKEMSRGNFNVNLQVTSNDEIGELTETFIKMKNNIFLMTEKINQIVVELKAGDLDAQIDESSFEGAYRQAVHSINFAIDSLIKETLSMLEGFNQIGKGDFTATIPSFPGKKVIANKMFDELKGNMNSLRRDVGSLIAAAADGKLDARVDTSLYFGDWQVLTQDLNDLLQAITSPIDEANSVLGQLSKGNFDISINKSFKGNFADMMNSLDKMVVTTRSYIDEISVILEAVAQGDLRKNINREYVGQYNIIKESINHIIQNLSKTIVDIKASADTVLTGSKQIANTSMSLAQGASMQASSVEELNSYIITLNEKAGEMAQRTNEVNEYSSNSATSAKNGNAEMLKMQNSMDEIKEASKNISKIIKVIDDIAFQTNLLALNASTEAARAGEHGKGFSIVAEEVRSLAGRTLRSAKDTSALIEDIIAKINDGTLITNRTAESLQKIVADTNLVSEIINSISLSATEQKDCLAMVSTGIDHISAVVQNNSSTSEESAAAAQELNTQSEMLADMVANFKI